MLRDVNSLFSKLTAGAGKGTVGLTERTFFKDCIFRMDMDCGGGQVSGFGFAHCRLRIEGMQSPRYEGMAALVL